MSDVGVAERKGRARALIFYLLALVLTVSAASGVGHPATARRVLTWMVMAGLAAANLTSLATTFRRAGWARLLDDESVRDHRRTALGTGFWAALVAAMLGGLLGPATDAFGVARLVIAAALATALISFATLELRAGRD